jgi:hypothetical protein
MISSTAGSLLLALFAARASRREQSSVPSQVAAQSAGTPGKASEASSTQKVSASEGGLHPKESKIPKTEKIIKNNRRRKSLRKELLFCTNSPLDKLDSKKILNFEKIKGRKGIALVGALNKRWVFRLEISVLAGVTQGQEAADGDEEDEAD